MHSKLVSIKSAKIFVLLLTQTMLFSIYSCEFSPTGSNYVEITPEIQPAYINLDFNSDTVKIWGEKNISYNINISGLQLRRVKIFFDDVLLTQTSQLNGDFYFDSEKYSNSAHKLKIEVTSSSGTGSISDKLGVETVLFVKEWVLVIDNAKPVRLAITSIEPYEGRLKITWEKYENFNFEFYSLNLNGFFLTIIYDQEKNYWIDSNYVSGPINYSVNVTAAGQVGIGNACNYFSGNPEVFADVNDSGKVNLSWTKNLFYNNFEYYQVRRVFNENSIKTIATLYGINDTTYIDEDPPFGCEYKYQVLVSGYYESLSSGAACYIGNKMLEFQTVEFIPSLNSIYIKNRDGYYRLDPENLSVLAHQDRMINSVGEDRLALSRNGVYAYISADNNFYRLNPLSLAVEQTYSTNSIVKYNSYIQMGFKVSDSNFIAYTSWSKPNEVTYQFIGNVIFNLNTKTVVEALSAEESSWFCFISANNKYFYTSGNLYGIVKDNLVKSGSEKTGQFSFIEDGEEYIILNNNIFQVKRSRDMSLRSSMSFESAANFSYDPATGYLGFSGSYNGENYYFVYDINTWKEIIRIHVFDSYGLFFANSTLFGYQGYYLHLNLD
ncbi:MAG: hypothetical protein ACM34N_12015 [Ignavibacteria bacterium]